MLDDRRSICLEVVCEDIVGAYCKIANHDFLNGCTLKRHRTCLCVKEYHRISEYLEPINHGVVVIELVDLAQIKQSLIF